MVFSGDGGLAFEVLNKKGKRKYIRIVEGNNFTGANRIAIFDKAAAGTYTPENLWID